MTLRLPLREEERIVKMLKHGVRHGDIAYAMQCSRQTVFRIARRHKIKSHPPGRPGRLEDILR